MKQYYKIIIALGILFTVSMMTPVSVTAWQVSVTNKDAVSYKVQVYYSIFAMKSMEKEIQPGKTELFDTGAECPITVGLSVKFDDGGSYQIEKRCTVNGVLEGDCIHTCWNTNWFIQSHSLHKQ